MTVVAAGTRLVLRSGGRTIPLRTLGRTEFTGRWSVPVLAPLQALSQREGTVEVTTEHGLLRTPAHLRMGAHRLELCSGGSASPALMQRRQDVRGAVTLPLRAAAADAVALRELPEDVVSGRTLDLSAGGLRVDLPGTRLVGGLRLYLELTLPDERLVPAVVALLDREVAGLRGRFVDIAPADRERLVRLVFEEQRRRLQGRLRVRDGG